MAGRICARESRTVASTLSIRCAVIRGLRDEERSDVLEVYACVRVPPGLQIV